MRVLPLCVLLILVGCGPTAAAPAATRAPATATAPPRPTVAPTAVPKPPTATPVPPKPTLTPGEIAGAQWATFLDYGPKLADLLSKSDQITRIHAQGAGIVTAGTVVDFYRLTDKAAAGHGELAMAALNIRVPSEARDFHNAAVNALSQREDAMNSLKDALNRPGVAVTAAYKDAREKVDRTTIQAVLQLLALCDSMQATHTECIQTVGWGGS